MHNFLKCLNKYKRSILGEFSIGQLLVAMKQKQTSAAPHTFAGSA